MRDTKSVSKRGASSKVILTSLGMGAVLAVTRPAVLGKVLAATNQYEWTKLDELDRLGGWYSSAARSADGNSLILSVTDGGETGDWQESPLYISSNGGTTWQNVAVEVDEGIQNNWEAVDVSDNGQVMVAAGDWGWDIEENTDTEGKIFVSLDGGDTWANKTPMGGDDWSDVVVSGDGSTIVATQWGEGTIVVSEDSGDTWDTYQVDDGDNDAWNVKSISISDNGNKILVGGENSGDPYTDLFFSEDGGDNWEEISPDPDASTWEISHDMSADGSKIVASVMGDTDGVFISENNGDSWTEITPEAEAENSNDWIATAISDDGSSISVLDENEEGKMYLTGDDGANWTEEDPGQATEDTNEWQDLDFNEDGSKIIVTGEDNAYINGIPTAPTVTLDDAEGGKTITLTTPAGTTITCHSAIKESGLTAQDGAYSYPLGLVDFCFSGAGEENEVNLIFVTDLKSDEVTVRKYNPNTKAYTNITEATVTETTYEGKHALSVTYTIVDNGDIDTDPDEGEVADPVGLAVLGVSAPSTGFDPQGQSSTPVAQLLAIAIATTAVAAPAARKVYNRTARK